MKVWEWCFLVILCGVLLVITLVTKNLYVVTGTFLLAMYLKKHRPPAIPVLFGQGRQAAGNGPNGQKP